MKRLAAGAGRRLFAWRSALPLALLPALAVSAWRGPLADDEGGRFWTRLAPVAIGLGLVLRAWVAGHAPARSSMRGVRRFQADVLSTDGAYALVRHPLYAANLLVGGGVLCLLREPAGILAGLLILLLAYATIARAEDEFLAARFGDAHARWRARTPAFVPRTLRPPRHARRFSMRTVLRREHPTWLAVPLLALAADGWARSTLGGNLMLSRGWIAVTLAAALAFVVLRALKYRTRRLHVPGR